MSDDVMRRAAERMHARRCAKIEARRQLRERIRNAPTWKTPRPPPKSKPEFEPATLEDWLRAIVEVFGEVAIVSIERSEP